MADGTLITLRFNQVHTLMGLACSLNLDVCHAWLHMHVTLKASHIQQLNAMLDITAGTFCNGITISKEFVNVLFTRSSADSTTPNLSLDLANECPRGFFCPEGTAEPIGCPIGTYR